MMSFKELIDAYQGMIKDKQEVGKKLFEKIEERKIIVDNHPGCCVLFCGAMLRKTLIN